MSERPSVLVVGSVALDTVETPRDGRHDDLLGGSASYFSVVASMLAPVRMVAVVGEDFPEAHVELFRARGVDTDGLQRVPGRTFRWSGRYLPDMVGRETLDTQLNVFEQFQPVLSEAYRSTPFVFLANIHPALQRQVLDQMERPRLVAMDTMNLWIDTAREGLEQVLPSVNVLLINDEEARMLAGEHNLVRAAAAVRRMGPERLIIKRGDAGAMLFDDAGMFWAPAYPVEQVVDPTGAGDSFAGGFVSYLAHLGDLSARSLRCAMIYGAAVASCGVEGFSLDSLRGLQRAEILQRCDAFGELVRFDAITL